MNHRMVNIGFFTQKCKGIAMGQNRIKNLFHLLNHKEFSLFHKALEILYYIV